MIRLADTLPQGDQLGAFAPLLGMMAVAFLVAVVLNVWHFYTFDRHEQRRRQQSTPAARRQHRMLLEHRSRPHIPPHQSQRRSPIQRRRTGE